LNEEDYFQNFTSFLNSYSTAGTYQFVFLKSLLYLPEEIDGKKRQWGNKKGWIKKNGNTTEVDLQFLAIPFMKYYWDMFYKFRLVQSAAKNQHGDEDINIHKLFVEKKGKKTIEKKPPKHLKDLEHDVYEPMRKSVVKKSMREVLRALNDKGFWKKIPQTKRDPKTKRKSGYLTTKSLTFYQDQIDFFRKYRTILDTAINFELTRHLEKINPYNRNIAKAVLIEIPRGNLRKKENDEYIKKYKKSKNFTCFYCKCKKKVGKGEPARDHVIPFDFVLSDELYNSVPSCKACNSEKSNKLPHRKILDAVIIRNREIKNKDNYTEKEYRKLYNHCKDVYSKGREVFTFQKRNCS